MKTVRIVAVICSILFVMTVGGASALVDYCSTNTFVSNSTYLQFTKEVSTMEYAVANKFKSLHCCAKGYRSIEWYKDERAYPWPGDVSTFILYPEAANQTIYSQVVADTDRGNYTCLMRNDTHIHMHTVILGLVDKTPPAPRATFIPSDKWVDTGSSVRLYCEAFVGRIDLPDAQSDISWRKIFPDHNTELIQEKVTREDGQILGAYLIIDQIKSDDYGQYVCSIGNADSFLEMPVWLHQDINEPGAQLNPIPWRDLTFVAIGAILSIITVAVLYARFGQKVALRCRNATISFNRVDEKEYDVFVVYTEVDAALVVEVLIPTMQNKYSYKCINGQLPNDTSNWFQLADRLATMSRAVLAVVSPSQMTSSQLLAVLTQLHSLSSHLVVVLLQEIPKFEPTPKDNNGENLDTMLRKTRMVPWRHLHDKNFWIGLQLSLPPPITSFNFTSNKETYHDFTSNTALNNTCVTDDANDNHKKVELLA